MSERRHLTGIGIDWTQDPESLSDTDRERINSWYSEYHGEGNLDLAPFVPFWLRHHPGVFLRYRRWVESLQTLPGMLSNAALQLVLAHHYTVIGYDRGLLYEIIGARKGGATKRQVLETMAYAYTHTGPPGMTPSCAIAMEYMDDWDDTGEVPDPAIWPDGWAVDAETMSCGLDWSVRGLAAGEADRLATWYQGNYGEVPSHIAFLAEHHPEGLKAYRSRVEYPTGGTLPAQVFPLFRFLSAACRGNATAMRRAAHQARQLGVARDTVIALACLTTVYLGDLRMDEVADAMEPILAEWPI